MEIALLLRYAQGSGSGSKLLYRVVNSQMNFHQVVITFLAYGTESGTELAFENHWQRGESIIGQCTTCASPARAAPTDR